MEELIQKAKNGDKEAFTTIMLSLEKDLYKIAKTRLKNDDDIYDAIQETIIEAFKSIKKLKNTEAFKTWIIRILINKTNDIFRRKKHKKEILLEDIKNTEILNSYEEKDIDNLLDFNFMRKQLKYEDSVKGEYFNGTTNYKTLGFTNYNSATISLVARFKIESYNSGVAHIFGNPEGAGSGLYLKDGKPGYEVFYSSNSSWTEVNATNRVSLNKWHTLVGTYESGTQKLYLDGTLVASTSSGVGTLVKTSTAPFAIGVNPTDTGVDGTYFNGYISDVLAINSSLTSSIVSSYYGSNFNRSYNNTNTLFKYTTEGSSYKLKGYNLGYASDGIQLQLDGKNNRGYSRSSSVKTWYDLSNNQNNGTITGTTWGSNYLSFASSSDHVEKTSAKYNISSEYTLEVVLRPIDQVDRYQSIFNTVNTGAAIKQYMTLWSSKWDDVYTNSSYRIENSDGTDNKVIYYSGIEKNTTYTLSATLNGKTLKLYKNGSLVSTNNLTITPRMSESGMYISSSSYPFDGYIYSIRVYNRELSASEISANYQNDKSRFGF